MQNKIILLVLIIIFLLNISCSNKKDVPSQTVSKPIEGQDTAPLVRIISAKHGTIEEKLQVTGSMETWDDVKISAKIPGKVTKVFFDEGDYVKDGDILFQIEDTEINIQLRQALMSIKSTEVLINKARMGIKLMDDKIAVMLKQSEAGVEVQKAIFTKVKAGARQEEKDQAKLGVEQAHITLDNAKTSYERLEKLFKSGTVPKPQYEVAKLQYDLAESRLKLSKEMQNLIEAGARDEDKAAAEASLNASQAALEMVETTKQEKTILEEDIKNLEIHLSQARLAQELIQTTLENTKITSPMSGVVIKKTINHGEMTAPGVPVFFISKLDPLKLKTEIPENEISKIKIGLLAELVLDAYPDKIFTGKISHINPILNPNSRTCGIEIKITNSSGLLKPGMFSRITINTGKKDNALLIPRDVLIENNNKFQLFLVRNETTVLNSVKLGLFQDESVEILEGVNEEDEIISVGKEYIKDGMKVRVME
ncbi:MAG: efflux RND transporter periplasmic adaptor subunit [Candidatus Firestonebacteria bacterium]|nr:efflux RND transporter periplasmic adaptor subunit [Candidatus Firestonebacteria bacterium]